MISAPEAFMAVANATAAIVQKAPPYVTYRVRGVIQVAKGEGAVDRIVSVRTEDGDAIVRDNNTGKEVLRPPFPAPPNFDALSTFEARGDFNLGALRGRERPVGDMRVSNIEPLHYATVVSRADAVARSVRGYHITYADDATPQQGHLRLEPSAENRSMGMWLSDVWYDPATMTPTRVLYAGDQEFVLDARYATTDGVWLLSSIVFGEHWRGRATVAFRCEYSEYRFATAPPDPRLAPAEARTPQPLGT